MSIVTTESKITRAYLRNKTKEEIIDHVMRLLDENDKQAPVSFYCADGCPSYGDCLEQCENCRKFPALQVPTQQEVIGKPVSLASPQEVACRAAFEHEYLLRSGYVRFHSSPWDAAKRRYRDANLRRLFTWFEAGWRYRGGSQ